MKFITFDIRKNSVPTCYPRRNEFSLEFSGNQEFVMLLDAYHEYRFILPFFFFYTN